MKANELRIGNYIQKNGEVSVLASINCDDTIRVFNDDKSDTWGCFALRIFETIKITKDWLLKFGFVYDGNWHYQIGENPITKDHLLDICWISDAEYPFYRNGAFRIKSVNELQNLYFALTGEELCEE